MTVSISCFTLPGQGQAEPCWLHHSPVRVGGSPPREWSAQALTGPVEAVLRGGLLATVGTPRTWGWAGWFLLPRRVAASASCLQEAAEPERAQGRGF